MTLLSLTSLKGIKTVKTCKSVINKLHVNINSTKKLISTELDKTTKLKHTKLNKHDKTLSEYIEMRRIAKNTLRSLIRQEYKSNPKKTKYTARTIKTITHIDINKICHIDTHINDIECTNSNINNDVTAKQKEIFGRKQDCHKFKIELYNELYKYSNTKGTKEILQKNKKLELHNKLHYCGSFEEAIDDLACKVQKLLNQVHHDNFKYNSALITHDLLYGYLMKASGKCTSIGQITQHLKSKDIAYVTNEGFRKKMTLLDPSYLMMIFDALYKYIYVQMNSDTEVPEILENNIHFADQTKRTKFETFMKQIYGTDGTCLNLVKSIAKDGYKMDSTKKYCKMLTNSMYNITYGIPVDFDIRKDFKEAVAFENQIDKMEPGSLLLADGHYSTKDIIDKLYLHGHSFVIKIAGTHKICDHFLKSKKKNDIVKMGYNNNDVKLYKFTINGKHYALGTNLLDEEYTAEFIKKLYEMRWYIEDFFRTLKSVTKLKGIYSQNETSLRHEIYSRMILCLLTRYIEHLGMQYLPRDVNANNTKKINTSNSIKTMGEEIIYRLIYMKTFDKEQHDNYIKKIRNCVFDMINCLCDIEDERFETRHRTRPVTSYVKRTFKRYNDIM